MSADAAFPAFLRTRRLDLRGLHGSDATVEYLSWLNDPAVLRFRAPKAFPSTLSGLHAFIESIPSRGDLVLAIRTREDGRHIGNIALNTIQWVHGTAEVSLMLGAKDKWGQGYGREAIHGVMLHAFSTMGLRRLWSESPNPAFNKAVEALGWKMEGVKRRAFLLEGDHVDIHCHGILRDEFTPRPELMAP